MQKRVPEEAPSHVHTRLFCTHFFDVAKKSRSWVSLPKKSVHARVQKPFQNKCKIFGTGSRRGVTPGRLGAQNRRFFKGFRPEGRLHRTRGRDRPGAHSVYCWCIEITTHNGSVIIAFRVCVPVLILVYECVHTHMHTWIPILGYIYEYVQILCSIVVWI